MFVPSTYQWWFFGVIVLTMLVVDLFAHRHPHKVKFQEALVWSGIWIGLALAFNAWIYFEFGPQKALKFLTGYVVEKSLSMDNVFVFIMLFETFKVPPKYQHRVLFWGVFGAIIMRAILIYFGLVLIQAFAWTLYIFGAFLLYTAYKMLTSTPDPVTANNPVLLWCQRHFRVTKSFVQENFIVKQRGKWFVTPLFIVLVFVEFSDLVFAIDSIPAIFAITTDPFLVYTSNIFAILGLRALYFAIGHAIQYLQHLKIGLGIILGFVGCKMLAHNVYHVPPLLSLAIILGILFTTILTSYLAKTNSRS
jgi:tellurite resistance protein TerC